MKKKEKTINIRVSENELKAIQEKSKEFKSMSAFLLWLVENSNGSNYTFKKLDYMNEFAQTFKGYTKELNSIGVNINQIAHYLNSGLSVPEDHIIWQFKTEIDKCLLLITEQKAQIEDLKNKLLDLKK